MSVAQIEPSYPGLTIGHLFPHDNPPVSRLWATMPNKESCIKLQMRVNRVIEIRAESSY